MAVTVEIIPALIQHNLKYERGVFINYDVKKPMITTTCKIINKNVKVNIVNLRRRQAE